MTHKIAVAYDQETGRILHMHHFFSAAGLSQIDEGGVAAVVLRDTAAATGRDGSTIGIAFAEQQHIDQGRAYRFDPQTRRLVFIDHKTTGASSASKLTVREKKP